MPSEARMSAVAEAVLGKIKWGGGGVWVRRLPVGDSLVCMLAGSNVGHIFPGRLAWPGAQVRWMSRRLG